MPLSDNKIFHQIIEAMEKKGFKFLPGLTDSEVQTAQEKWKFRFPPDLLGFLQAGLPAPRLSHHIEHKAFPNWRSTEEEDMHYIRYRMNWPMDMLLWDIEYQAHWIESWGKRPEPIDDVRQIATRHIQNAPRLIPIFMHHYIPASPTEAGNPIFSMRGFDLTISGNTLSDFFIREFQLNLTYNNENHQRTIQFWGDLAQ